MAFSQEARYKAKKIWKVVLWTVIPYILIKIPQELLRLPDFAEYSFILNILIYLGNMVRKEPTKAEMRLEGV